MGHLWLTVTGLDSGLDSGLEYGFDLILTQLWIRHWDPPQAHNPEDLEHWEVV